MLVSVVNMYKKNNEQMCSGVQEVFYCVQYDHMTMYTYLFILYPHVLNVLVQYLTCTSPEY